MVTHTKTSLSHLIATKKFPKITFVFTILKTQTMETYPFNTKFKVKITSPKRRRNSSSKLILIRSRTNEMSQNMLGRETLCSMKPPSVTDFNRFWTMSNFLLLISTWKTLRSIKANLKCISTASHWLICTTCWFILSTEENWNYLASCQFWFCVGGKGKTAKQKKWDKNGFQTTKMISTT